MKNKLSVLFTCTLLTCCLKASVFYTNATNLWFQGQQTAALSLAENRLATNTNDLPALIVKASYDFDFSGAAQVSNTFARVLSLGPTVQTTEFGKRYVLLRKMCERTLDFVGREDPVQRVSDAERMRGPGHYMRFYFALRALEEDEQIED